MLAPNTFPGPETTGLYTKCLHYLALTTPQERSLPSPVPSAWSRCLCGRLTALGPCLQGHLRCGVHQMKDTSSAKWASRHCDSRSLRKARLWSSPEAASLPSDPNPTGRGRDRVLHAAGCAEFPRLEDSQLTRSGSGHSEKGDPKLHRTRAYLYAASCQPGAEVATHAPEVSLLFLSDDL